MTKEFDEYEGFKMACLSAYRTIEAVDGLELSSKLLWAISNMYQAIGYAMLFYKNEWDFEVNPQFNNSVIDTITKSEGKEDLLFIQHYNTDFDDFQQKLRDIEYVRHNVLHANSKQLEQWSLDIVYLLKLIYLCQNIVNDIVTTGQKTGHHQGEEMKNWFFTFQHRMNRALESYPRN
jgi:hypothetical protein